MTRDQTTVLGIPAMMTQYAAVEYPNFRGGDHCYRLQHPERYNLQILVCYVSPRQGLRKICRGQPKYSQQCGPIGGSVSLGYSRLRYLPGLGCRELTLDHLWRKTRSSIEPVHQIRQTLLERTLLTALLPLPQRFSQPNVARCQIP